MDMAIDRADDDVQVPVSGHIVDERSAVDVVPKINSLGTGLSAIEEVEMAIEGGDEQMQAVGLCDNLLFGAAPLPLAVPRLVRQGVQVVKTPLLSLLSFLLLRLSGTLLRGTGGLFFFLNFREHRR
jgi:hypothetical protein